MINIKDIRLGNYVKDRGGKILRVDFIEYAEIGYDSKFGQKMYIGDQEVHPMREYSDYAEPIQLTPEWLSKFGLLYLQNACWELGSMRVYNLSEDARSRFRISIAGNEITILSYVHQFQNFYHSIAFKELIWVADFMKTGYTAPARKLAQNKD